MEPGAAVQSFGRSGDLAGSSLRRCHAGRGDRLPVVVSRKRRDCEGLELSNIDQDMPEKTARLWLLSLAGGFRLKLWTCFGITLDLRPGGSQILVGFSPSALSI